MSAKKLEVMEDLLTSIFIELPPKSVYRFRCVSNRWNKIICHSLFLKSYSARNQNQRLLGFIEFSRHQKNMAAKIYPIAQTDVLKPSGLGTYIHSSNGLVLCYERPSYYVLNPLTNGRFTLPPRSFKLWQMGLTCDENVQELAPSFKVIGFLTEEKAKTVVTGTYSSTTRKWTTSTLSGPDKCFRLRVFDYNGFVSNGVFHWRADDKLIAIYDSKQMENHLQLIEEPPLPGIGFQCTTLTRSSKDDVFWAGGEDDFIIAIWMLPKDDADGSYRRSTTIPKEEWIMAYKISKDSLMIENFCALCTLIYLEALIIGDTMTAILNEGDGRAYIYDTNRESIELVFSSPSAGYLSLTPFMEPLLSSYALSTSIQ